MKRIAALLIFISIDYIGFAQTLADTSNETLKGDIELTVDLSKTVDTAGVFVIQLGGKLFYPTIENHTLHLKYQMDEPRASSLHFYRRDTIIKYPNKRLNEIAIQLRDYFTFLGQPGKFTITVKDSVSQSYIANPTSYQKDFQMLIDSEADFRDKTYAKNKELLNQINQADSKLKRDSLLSAFYKIYRLGYAQFHDDVILGYIKNNPNSPTSLNKLEEITYQSNRDVTTLNFLFNNLSDRIKGLPTAQRIYSSIDQETFTKNNLLGKAAFDFTQADTSGHSVSLKNFRGHITLIEFWASWCGPCRAANPALVKTYKNFESKGFKILAVSLDNNKQNWFNAIKEDNLNWTHVSDLKQFNNEVAKLYHVAGIPANYLLDKDGKVIAQDIKEKELNEYLLKNL